MIADDLTEAVAELSALADASPHRCLGRLVELVARGVPGCAGATSTVWMGGELVSSTASHPDLAALLDLQLAMGSGPLLDAVRTGSPATCTDTLAELEGPPDQRRWPTYAADALRLGVRCSATLVHMFDGLLVTLTLYGARPRAFDPAAVPLASLLAAVGGISLVNASQYDDSRRTASQLEEAVNARAVVDQAKGLLMNALGCDADEALARLRQLSQTRNVKVTEIARKLVEEHSLARSGPPKNGPAKNGPAKNGPTRNAQARGSARPAIRPGARPRTRLEPGQVELAAHDVPGDVR